MYSLFEKLGLATLFGALLLVFSISVSGSALAAGAGPTAKGADSTMDAFVGDELYQYVRGGRRGGGGASRGGGGSRNKNVNRNKNTNVNRNRNTNVNRNVNRNVNVNVNVRHRGYGWRGARWGAVAFGVVMGTAIIVAYNTPPIAPNPELCWTWSNSALTRGYWYYCSGP
jgi:hypothetical protein